MTLFSVAVVVEKQLNALVQLADVLTRCCSYPHGKNIGVFFVEKELSH